MDRLLLNFSRALILSRWLSRGLTITGLLRWGSVLALPTFIFSSLGRISFLASLL